MKINIYMKSSTFHYFIPFCMELRDSEIVVGIWWGFWSTDDSLECELGDQSTMQSHPHHICLTSLKCECVECRVLYGHSKFSSLNQNNAHNIELNWIGFMGEWGDDDKEIEIYFQLSIFLNDI